MSKPDLVPVPRDVVEAALKYLISEHNDPRDYPGRYQSGPGTDSAWALIEALREALS